MSGNETNLYDLDPHVAEIYDLIESGTADVDFIRRLTAGLGALRVLEPFCGTGRLLVPLALNGHTVTGLDQSEAMLERARRKAAALPAEVQARLNLVKTDVTGWNWPRGFDLVVLGGNGLYELATPEEQEGCIAAAAASLAPGGHVYIDSNHMEGELAADWRPPGLVKGALCGMCADGATVENYLETIWYDAPLRLVRFHHMVRITPSKGPEKEYVFVQQKHPVSHAEVRGWLLKHGFIIEGEYGDRDGSPYSEGAGRMIFWAHKRTQLADERSLVSLPGQG